MELEGQAIDTDALDLEYQVLVVEGNRKRANNLKYILDGLYVTEVVSSVAEAIDYINHHDSPDLIISSSDFNSVHDFIVSQADRLDGVELCQYVRDNKKSSVNAIPIIILMNSDNQSEKIKFLNEGAADVFPPDYNMLDLFAKMESLLERVAERKKLFESIQDLIEDKKVRNRKNVDFRTKLFAKHRESVAEYEGKITKLREQIAEKNEELQSAKVYIQDLKRENIELLNELTYIRSQSESKKEQPDSGEGLSSATEEQIGEIENLFKHINQEYLFEENIVKEIVDAIIENGELDFKKVDNFYFINNIQRVLKGYIRLSLDRIYTESSATDKKNKCRSLRDMLIDYILKVYINKFLFFFAMELLEVIGTKDENATRFLKFYDGRIEIAPDGQRFQKPLIGGGKEGAWNMISMMQIINQRANGHKIIVEQEENIQRVNSELSAHQRTFDLLLSGFNNIMIEPLKKQKPLEEKISLLEDIIRSERKELSFKEQERIEFLDDRLNQLNSLKDELFKTKTAKDVLMSKYSKQVSYYKPTEEKFAKVALSVAKVMLKVKIITGGK